MALIQKDMGVSGPVSIDWETVVDRFKRLDDRSNYEDSNEEPFGGASIARLLGEYGLIARKAASQPSGTCLAIVVWPPIVWFCPSQNGMDGVFVEPYDKRKHGEGLRISKSENIWDFSNLDAIRDGWRFHAQMIFAGAGE